MAYITRGTSNNKSSSRYLERPDCSCIPSSSCSCFSCHLAMPKFLQHTLTIPIHVASYPEATDLIRHLHVRRNSSRDINRNRHLTILLANAGFLYWFSDIRLFDQSKHCYLPRNTDAYKLASLRSDELGRIQAFGQVDQDRSPQDRAPACLSLPATILGTRT
jgi:hypothetical protein